MESRSTFAQLVHYINAEISNMTLYQGFLPKKCFFTVYSGTTDLSPPYDPVLLDRVFPAPLLLKTWISPRSVSREPTLGQTRLLGLGI